MAKEKPIIFSAESVVAIFGGQKTQTRRVVKNENPRYRPGDILWVKEPWGVLSDGKNIVYRAESQCWNSSPFVKWKSSMYMPRYASRLTVKVINVRRERLQDISEEDAIAEGVATIDDYKTLWDKINGKKYPWESNPLVWVIEFERNS